MTTTEMDPLKRFLETVRADLLEPDSEWEREQAERQERARQQALQATENRIRQAIAGLPIVEEMTAAIVADTIGATPAVSTVQRWRGAQGKSTLLLLGGVGCGKTVAAAWAIAHEVRHNRYHSAQYAKMRDAANLFRAGFGEDLKAFEKMLECGLLVIDELTTERDADLGRACLHEIIDWRGSKGAPTLLLANRTKAEIAKHYDPRTIDRLRECAAVVELVGKSMRKGAW